MEKKMEERIKKIEKACEKYHFTCHASVNGVFIRTGSLAGWFILLDKDGAKLYHENYRHCERYGHGVMERYHEHTNIRESEKEEEIEMVEYIRAHDLLMNRNQKKKKIAIARHEKFDDKTVSFT